MVPGYFQSLVIFFQSLSPKNTDLNLAKTVGTEWYGIVYSCMFVTQIKK